MAGVYSWGAGKSATTPEQFRRFVVSAFGHGRMTAAAGECPTFSPSGDGQPTGGAERAGDGEWRAANGVLPAITLPNRAPPDAP